MHSRAVVGELGRAPAAEVGEDEGCCPRLPTKLTLNPTRQINQLFRGHRVCLGQASEERQAPVLRHRSHRPVRASSMQALGEGGFDLPCRMEQ